MKRKSAVRLSAIIFSLMLLTGCVTQPIDRYYWGEYEQLVYDMYINPGKADPGQQIDKLSADIQKAQQNGKPVPPGIYAHLGFMYAIQGNITASQSAFSEEKTLYPESTVLVDGMMKRALKEEQS